MDVVIQAILSREKQAEILRSQLPTSTIVYDYEMRGPINGFRKCLDVPLKTEYRLHIQDDVILAKRLDEYLPHIEKYMSDNDLKVVVLYSGNQKKVKELNDGTLKYVKIDTKLLCGPAIVYHKDIIEELRERIKHTKEKRDDDTFIIDALIDLKVDVYAHLPSIIQHNVWLGSSVGHAKSRQRMSMTFNINFIDEILQ